MLTAGNASLVNKWHYFSININTVDAGALAKITIKQ
jgi:hypothetical protein